MKIVRFTTADNKVEYGIQEDGIVRGIEGLPYGRLKDSGSNYKLSELKLLSPCTPSKILGVQRNSRRVIAKLNVPLPPEPMVFLKPPTSVIGPDDDIIYPESSHWVNYEAEVGVVMKTQAYRVSKEDALNYVLGYTCFNDVSAMDWLYEKNQMALSKSFDTFAAIGPCIETDIDPLDVWVETYLNGEPKERGNTNELIFSIPEQISFISHVMTLLPGDVITTGTPGCNSPMKRGDSIEIKIESIGTLRNYVV